MERNKVYVGNSLDVLKTFPDESIDMCITSPPYWGLRDYGTEGQVWGGDEKCSKISPKEW
jgi:DNA modification methylase